MPCYTSTKVRFDNPRSDTDIGKNRLSTAGKTETTPCINVRLTPSQEALPRQSEKITRARTCYLYNQRGKKLKYPIDPTKEATLRKEDIERIKANAKIITMEERAAIVELQEKEAQRLNDMADELRLRYKRIDDERRNMRDALDGRDKFSDTAQKLNVLERSFVEKHEQEEEVQLANRVIINLKCQAVRDEQILEKKEIERLAKQADAHMVQIQMNIAAKSLAEEDKKEEEKRLNRILYAADIRQQLNERERIRLLEGQRIEKEALKMREAMEELKRDEELQAKLILERKLQFRRELDKVAEMSMVFKKMLCEQDLDADMRVLAFKREQEIRQRKFDEEKRIAKKEFDRKQDKLFVLGQKALESRSRRDEMSYMREQERLESEYRRKEMEAALRKKRVEKELCDARKQQLLDSKNRHALYIAHAEQEFNDLIVSIKSEEEEQKKMDALHKKLRENYRNDIIRQINDKEAERRRLLDLEKNQVSTWRKDERKREQNIRTIINAKLAAMKDAKLPEKYITEVQQRITKIFAKYNN
ncbi:cilia- and flagella-associated protein 45-like [Teleopsis dalmanni]|uniref:cilia- and flagella-associated protein 45-like n=1 Tax=Teleopsis dalmanni TaxID=139649 RepID=UPI0018CF3C85|nr:cilia- and flagella-associated protein 45-like [Teleopsis dalmanni]